MFVLKLSRLEKHFSLFSYVLLEKQFKSTPLLITEKTRLSKIKQKREKRRLFSHQFWCVTKAESKLILILYTNNLLKSYRKRVFNKKYVVYNLYHACLNLNKAFLIR